MSGVCEASILAVDFAVTVGEYDLALPSRIFMCGEYDLARPGGRGGDSY